VRFFLLEAHLPPIGIIVPSRAEVNPDGKVVVLATERDKADQEAQPARSGSCAWVKRWPVSALDAEGDWGCV
jgi:hypothetical protein